MTSSHLPAVLDSFGIVGRRLPARRGAAWEDPGTTLNTVQRSADVPKERASAAAVASCRGEVAGRSPATFRRKLKDTGRSDARKDRAMDKKKLKGAHELKDLDVERVDAVDKPATGRAFLLFKSQEDLDAVTAQMADALGVKRRQAVRKRGKGLFTSAIFGPRIAEEEIEKDEGIETAVREYNVEDLYQRSDASARADQVATALNALSGRVEDGTRRPQWARDSFLHGDAEDAGELANTQRLTQTNDTDHTPEEAVGGNHFPSAEGLLDVVATPQNFERPVPKLRRQGDIYVMRSEDQERLGDALRVQDARLIEGYPTAVAKARSESVKAGAPHGEFRVSFADVIFS
jgi:hypothetical protein